MIIDCISDLHGNLPELEGGDLLIVAGDLTAHDTILQYKVFIEWLLKQNYRKKVLISGNHDGKLQNLYRIKEKPDLCYLEDSGCEFDGLKIWGSPWTPEFGAWSFMKKRGPEMKEVWDKIPMGTDILVTHGPPFGILDKCSDDDHVGCEELRIAVMKVKPKLHVFGHIHEQGGKMIDLVMTKFVNASIMNEFYYPTNKPVRIYL